MVELWFISDTHFFHANMYKFLDDKGQRVRRQFETCREGDEAMIERWNVRVRPQDHIYHLGDVTFRYDRPFHELMHRLQGHKRLLLGNHDRIKGNKLLDFFEKVYLWRGFREFNFTASHMPLRLEGLRDGKFNVHGHIHERVMADPHYINVSVEQTNYAPIHLDEIRKIIAEREKSL